MRIVVVEDEYMIRCGVAKLVSKINPEYEVVGEAENGVDGIEVITRLKPDLVIVDIKMPQMDGIEMLVQLKREGVKHKTLQSLTLLKKSIMRFMKISIKKIPCKR